MTFCSLLLSSTMGPPLIFKFRAALIWFYARKAWGWLQQDSVIVPYTEQVDLPLTEMVEAEDLAKQLKLGRDSKRFKTSRAGVELQVVWQLWQVAYRYGEGFISNCHNF
jgi:hypothetical protein